MESTGTVEGNEGQRAPSSRGAKRALVAVALCVAASILLLGVFLLASWMSANSDKRQAVPDVVERVFPGVGDGMLRQDRVGVDVKATYWCSLTIDGKVIPDDQLDGNKETGECYYRPGEPEAEGEKEIEEFSPGPHSASATIWSLADPENRVTFTWDFDVL